MPTAEEIEEQKKAQLYLEEARIRARTVLHCISYRHDPANPTCPFKTCPPWRVEACREIQELIGQHIEPWRKEIEQKAREKERARELLDSRR